jgi:8-oxo-dGTP diphosphatase
LTLDDDGASPALAEPAAELGTVQLQVVAEGVEKWRGRVEVQCMGPAVDLEIDCHVVYDFRPTLTSMVEVVAAVIMRDGKILIGQRKRGGRHPLKWEFPGGKVEPGEDPRAALARELREELNVEAVIGEEMDSYEVSYEDGFRILLRFYRVTEFQGDLRNLDFEQVLWEKSDKLPEYDFLEGDVGFISKLARWPAEAE